MRSSERLLTPFPLLLAIALSEGAAYASAPTERAAAPQGYPARQALVEFKQACGLIPNIEGTARNVVQAGWAEIKDGLPPEMTRFLWFAQTEGDKIVQSKGGQSRTMRVFHKSVSGEETYIVLSEILIDKVRVTGCRLFDFGETRAIKTSEAERFLGRPATKTQAYPEIQISDWEPGLVPEHDSFQIFYVPPGSPAAEMVNFTGIALKADTVGSAE